MNKNERILMELSLEGFFFDLPIYTPVEINTSNESVFKEIIDCNNRKEFHGYNPWKKYESTFVVTTDLIPPHNSSFLESGGRGVVKIQCKRSGDVFSYFVVWQPSTKIFLKAGQFPSVADFHISEIKQYANVLSSEKIKEFTRAIGLAANGVGIGSFVYLRRIFEHLIAEAYELCLADGTITEEVYCKSRMDQKIEILSSHLPEFLVENKKMYSVLSLGIHELDEETCLSYFDTLRVGIEIVLDEKLEIIQKQKKILEAKKKLAQLNKS